MAEPPGGRDAEAGHHLVADEQGTVLAGQLAQQLGEPRCRWDDAHVPGRGFGDQAGDAVSVLSEDGADGVRVVVRDDERVGSAGPGHPGCVGQGERGHARAGGRQ
jgi:hypothetical protein